MSAEAMDALLKHYARCDNCPCVKCKGTAIGKQARKEFKAAAVLVHAAGYDEGHAAGRDEALREVVAWLRALAGSAYPEKRGKLHDIADDLEAAFPTTEDT